MCSLPSCLFIFCVLVAPSNAGYSPIINREHLQDVLFDPGQTTTRAAAVLVLYKTSCPPPLLRVDRDHFLLYFIHDYETEAQIVWHEPKEKKLYDLYVGENGPCLSAVYFDKGDSLETPRRRWDEMSPISLVDWFWEFFKQEIRVVNSLDEKVLLTHIRSDECPHVPERILEPKEEADQLTYATYILVVKKVGNVDVLDSVRIMPNLTTYVIGGKTEASTFDLIAQDDGEYQNMSKFVWDHTDRLLRNLKQPLIVHNYTELGYKKLPMPMELYTELHRFYRQGKQAAVDENMDSVVIRSNITKAPTLVPLSEEMISVIERTLQPQLEKWCRCSLKRTYIYGIREYYKGHVLYNHVDRVETHVISTILQIDQDLGGQKDWTLEVVTYQGERRQVKLLPGEMLFYESAKLVHGRPEVFHGKLFANAFVHFVPTGGWDFKFEGRNFVNHKTGVFETIDDLSSHLLLYGKVIPPKDEL